MKTLLSLNSGQLETIEQLATVNYSLYNISLYLDIPLKILESWMKDETSPAYLAYHKGKLETQFEIDSKLNADAKTGNLTAIQILDKHKKSAFIEETKRRILYGEES